MGVDPTVSECEIGSATQKSKRTGGLVSIVSYSRQSLMIIVGAFSVTVQLHRLIVYITRHNVM